MKYDGYITLHRKIRNHWLWEGGRELTRLEAWIDILMEVRHEQKPYEKSFGTTVLKCYRGQSLYSCLTWATRWKWSKSKVHRFLDMLVKQEMITLKSETVTTRLTVVNYDTYQLQQNTRKPSPKPTRSKTGTGGAPKPEQLNLLPEEDNSNERNASETEMKRKRNASETQVGTNKTVKTDKNEKQQPRQNDYTDAFKAAFDEYFPEPYDWLSGDFPQLAKWRKKYPDVTPERFVAVAKTEWAQGQYGQGAARSIRGLCPAWVQIVAKQSQADKPQPNNRRDFNPSDTDLPFDYDSLSIEPGTVLQGDIQNGND